MNGQRKRKKITLLLFQNFVQDVIILIGINRDWNRMRIIYVKIYNVKKKLEPSKISLSDYMDRVILTIMDRGFISSAIEVAEAYNDVLNVGRYKLAIEKLLLSPNHIKKIDGGFILMEKWKNNLSYDILKIGLNKQLRNNICREIKRNKAFKESLYGLVNIIIEKADKQSDALFIKKTQEKIKPKIVKNE